jgi:sec-independent protein translocase protein TatA
MFHSLGPLEIGLIVLLVLIIFGVGKLPQVGGALGKGIRQFRKGKSGEDEEENTKAVETKTEDKVKDNK